MATDKVDKVDAVLPTVLERDGDRGSSRRETQPQAIKHESEDCRPECARVPAGARRHELSLGYYHDQPGYQHRKSYHMIASTSESIGCDGCR